MDFKNFNLKIKRIYLPSNIGYLKKYIKISLVLTILSWIICLFLYFKDIDIDKFLFIGIPTLPFILICGGALIAKQTTKKYPKITKIITHTLDICLIIMQSFIILSYVLCIWIFLIDFDTDSIASTNISDYGKSLQEFQPSSTYYFPKEIPTEAKNIKFLKTAASFTGDCTLYLQFDASENYIRAEEQKYKNVSKTYIINNTNSSLNSDFDYSRARAVLGTIVPYENEDGYKVIVLDNYGFEGIAIKDRHIIYILYLD